MPDPWKEIKGQKTAFDLLSRIHSSNRIPHAFLFYGLEGVGKFYTAIQFARLLNQDATESVINKISHLEEPYVKYVFPLPRGKGESGDDTPTAKLTADNIEAIFSEIKEKSKNPYYKFRIDKANNIKISSIRDIKKFISMNYDDVKFRFIIIEDAHLMNNEAQNALLKSLEEPPQGIIFILITPYENRLLPTIESRCWSINFNPLSDNDIKEILVEYFGIENDLAERVSHFSDGSIQNALTLLNNNFEELLSKVIQILRFSLAKKYHSAHKLLSEYQKNTSKEELKQIIILIQKWINDVKKNRVDYRDYFFKDYMDTIEKFNSKFSYAPLETLHQKLEYLIELIGRNVGLNLIVLSIIFEIAAILKR